MTGPRARRSTASRARLALALVFGLIGALWVAQIRGSLSSNDGSHLALARALALEQRAELGPEAWRTLRVDLAVRDGRFYSDRPPGTAFAALPAAWLGAQLDPALTPTDPSTPTLVPAASELYASTARSRAAWAPPAELFVGTALAIGLHGVLMGLLGLGALAWILAHFATQLRAKVAGLVILAAGTAYGAYAPLLFSHVSAAAFAWLALAASLAAAQERARAKPLAALAGLCGAWAIACDYSLVLAIVPALALALPPRRWPWALAGALPMAAAVAAYHQAAFGSPFAIGYDFSTNFAFARSRASTFSGDPLAGAWTLLGAGHDAGLLVRAPVVLAGWIALALPPPANADADTRARLRWGRRSFLAFVPWLILLCFHRTPWGGAGADHRYLIVALPFALLGALGHAHTRARQFAWLALGLVSALCFWLPYLHNYELPYLARPGLGAGLALLWALGLALLSAAEHRRARRSHGAAADEKPSTPPTQSGRPPR